MDFVETLGYILQKRGSPLQTWGMSEMDKQGQQNGCSFCELLGLRLYNGFIGSQMLAFCFFFFLERYA